MRLPGVREPVRSDCRIQRTSMLVDYVGLSGMKLTEI